MTATIPLIDTLEGFELVRDQIAVILATEQALQVAEATLQGKPNPDDWKLRVYRERIDPVEVFRDGDETDLSPVVNVWYDNSSTELGAGDLGTRQMVPSQINVDCIGYARAKQDGTGHLPGDELAALTAQRGVRIARGILMHGKYRYLGLGTQPNAIVGRRYVLTRTAFQPTSGGRPVQDAVGVRLTFMVDHIETIGIETYANIEQIFVTHKFDPLGAVILEQDITFTP
jgi:hypothetical protein